MLLSEVSQDRVDNHTMPEQHVQVADTLLDVADLLLALDDESLLEVDLVLRGHGGEFLLLLLLELLW